MVEGSAPLGAAYMARSFRSSGDEPDDSLTKVVSIRFRAWRNWNEWSSDGRSPTAIGTARFTHRRASQSARWEGGALAARTTHVKAAHPQDGVPLTDQATIDCASSPRDVLTVLMVATDSVYLWSRNRLKAFAARNALDYRADRDGLRKGRDPVERPITGRIGSVRRRVCEALSPPARGGSSAIATRSIQSTEEDQGHYVPPPTCTESCGLRALRAASVSDVMCS